MLALYSTPYFNSTKVQFGGASRAIARYARSAISIPLRYNLEESIRQKQRFKSRISIPLRYNLEQEHNPDNTPNPNFNSTKVQFGDSVALQTMSTFVHFNSTKVQFGDFWFEMTGRAASLFQFH